MSFNVKKIGSASVIAAALFAASWGAQAADGTIAAAGQATVNFTAAVTDATCTPSWGANGVNVQFGKVSATDLVAAGDTGSTQRLTLKLKECTGITKVNVRAEGTADGANANAFANAATGEDAATNVGFVLKGGADTSTTLKPNDATGVDYALADNATTLDLPFVAELVATKAKATAGAASGSATLFMTYE